MNPFIPLNSMYEVIGKGVAKMLKFIEIYLPYLDFASKLLTIISLLAAFAAKIYYSVKGKKS